MSKVENEQKQFDAIIIGGGPAGLSALFWCHELGSRAALIERNTEAGGQLLRTFNPITNYMGVKATDGNSLRDIFVEQAGKGGELITGVEVIKADLESKTVVLSSGQSYSGRSMIIATGVRRRDLGVPGESEFYGRGVLESGVKARHDVHGKTVLIVGGGDAAIENASILSEKAAKVIVVHRSGRFRARESLITQAKSKSNIVFMTDSEVTKISGGQTVNSVLVRDVLSGRISTVTIDAVLVRIGVKPNTELFQDQIDRDSFGYIKVDSLTSTTMKCVFAVGDVVNRIGPTINAGVGQGMTAAAMTRMHL
jgi:thioredoxin reductase (NADPH)